MLSIPRHDEPFLLIVFPKTPICTDKKNPSLYLVFSHNLHLDMHSSDSLRHRSVHWIHSHASESTYLECRKCHSWHHAIFSSWSTWNPDDYYHQGREWQRKSSCKFFRHWLFSQLSRTSTSKTRRRPVWCKEKQFYLFLLWGHIWWNSIGLCSKASGRLVIEAKENYIRFQRELEDSMESMAAWLR